MNYVYHLVLDYDKFGQLLLVLWIAHMEIY